MTCGHPGSLADGVCPRCWQARCSLLRHQRDELLKAAKAASELLEETGNHVNKVAAALDEAVAKAEGK